MAVMKSAVFLACLLLPAVLPSPAWADPAPAAVSPSEASLAVRLRALLDEMEASQSQDFYEAARLVLAENGDPAAFYSLMEEASRAGSAAATVWLAPVELNRLAVCERLVPAHQPEALKARAAEMRARVRAAADKGYHPAYIYAANMMGKGLGGPVDEAAAQRYLVAGSKAGCAEARAGYLLFSGRLQKSGIKDPAVAAELSRNNYYLEELIARGCGDTAEGVKWLRLACEHGSALAPYLLTQSSAAALAEKESMEMLQLAADRHQPDAMDFLGNLKLRARELSARSGIALEEDVAGGVELLRLAATLGQPEAAQSLATAMAQGVLGTPSVQQVCSLYRMAAEQGDALGMAGYGYCLMAGRGCAADAETGLALLQRAIEAGAQWGNQALASVYFNGDGVKPDLRRAVNALGEDAALGSVHAYAIMAALTALGNEGAAPDSFRARVYLEMARDEDPEAQAVYDAIIAQKGWRFLSALWQP